MNAPETSAMSGEITHGSFSIWMDTSRMSAFLSLKAPENGGKAIKKEEIEADIMRLRIKKELVDFAKIEGALAQGFADEMPIARGREPVEGSDAQFISLLEEEDEEGAEDAKDENAVIDFRDRGEILTVAEGQELLRRVPAVIGKAGENVMGNPIPPGQVTDLGFASGLKGVAPKPGDPCVLVATISGQPVFVEQGVSVDPVFNVNNVNIATGNITFEGCIKITGEVQSTMSVRASGDIFIEGTVEGAIIEAGGDITVNAGIIGTAQGDKKKKDAFEPYIKCGGTLTAQFAQGIKIEAGNAIYIKDSAVQCELLAKNEIIVGKGNTKGTIVSGSARADHLIKAKIFGASNGAKTLVTVGFKPELQEMNQKFSVDVHNFEKKMNVFTKKMEDFKDDPKNPLNLKLNKAVSITARGAELAKKRRDAILEQIEALQESKIVAIQKMFPGVELRLAAKKIILVNEQDKSSFVVKDYPT